MPEKRKPFETNLDFIALDNEEVSRFRDLIADAHDDYQPRNLGERCLVNELAICHWRKLRVLIMQRAIYDRQQAEYDPATDPHSDELFGDAFHIAMAHTPDRYSVALAALGRLETRYQRQFCEALRLLAVLQNPSKKEEIENV